MCFKTTCLYCYYINLKSKEMDNRSIQRGIGVFCDAHYLASCSCNIWLDLLDQHSHLGYCMKDSSIKSSVKAYADDLSLLKSQKPQKTVRNWSPSLMTSWGGLDQWRRNHANYRQMSITRHEAICPEEAKAGEHKIQYVIYDPKLTTNRRVNYTTIVPQMMWPAPGYVTTCTTNPCESSASLSSKIWRL